MDSKASAQTKLHNAQQLRKNAMSLVWTSNINVGKEGDQDSPHNLKEFL
jgi:hypothetical protein